VQGPAMIEERDSTIVIGKNDRAMIDAFGNIVATLTDIEEPIS
jgi:N-methylhydantoinase A/oxoprolinase/acetone carboxylase beta subunit